MFPSLPNKVEIYSRRPKCISDTVLQEESSRDKGPCPNLGTQKQQETILFKDANVKKIIQNKLSSA